MAAPTLAEAKTKVVSMGPPTKQDAQAFQKRFADVNDFFPHGVTIHRGDSVRFVVNGFHSVDLPKTAGRVLPLVKPTGEKVTGSLDAAGRPFWFNGRPQLGFNRRLMKSSFGTRKRYGGRRAVRSGLPLGPAKPFTVRFTRTGRFTYHCNVHPGMKGKVRVRPRSRSIPTATQDARRVRNQVERALSIVKDLERTRTPASTVNVGTEGPHGVEIFRMFPRKLTVDVGASVLFRMSRGSFEDHTATFAPGSPDDRDSYLGRLVAGMQRPTFDPRSVYQSEPPGEDPATFTSALHGNGFWNSGVMDRATATPLPAFNSVRFGQRGTFRYYCLIHPFMVGSVTVR